MRRVVTNLGPCDKGCRCGLTIYELIILVTPLLTRDEIPLPSGYRWDEASVEILPRGYRVWVRTRNELEAKEAAGALELAIAAQLIPSSRLTAYWLGGGSSP